jgi:hypothetical protein
MISAGSSFRAVIAGSYGAFSGIGAGSAITTELNNNGVQVTSFTDDEPGLVNQLLQGDWFSRPYQIVLDGTVSQDFSSTQQLDSVITSAFWQVLSSAPDAVAVTLVNGITTGESASPPPIYPTAQLSDSIGGALDSMTQGIGSGVKNLTAPITSEINTVLIVLVVGIVAIFFFSPNVLKGVVRA